MATAGPNSGGTFASIDEEFGTDMPWDSPGNALSSDDTYATSLLGGTQTFTDRLECTNFGFSIPSGSTIDGITVVVHRKASTTNRNPRDYRVQLIVGGVLAGENKASVTTWPTTEGTATYGGSSDTWSAALTRSQVAASDFGVAVSAQRDIDDIGSCTFSVDYVTIAVEYSARHLVELFKTRRQRLIPTHI